MPPLRPPSTAPTPATLRAVRRRVLAWYGDAHRDFPWRRTHDPYAVLVSEVMLQQTQASRVAERFDRFMARFPTATALARAPDASVLAEWSGLGYNRRALALRRAAAVVDAHGWPTDPAQLERLSGVGRYTARAIASLAFGVPVGVVDTNVRRWLTRRFGLHARGGGSTPAHLQALADALANAGPAATSADDTAAWTHATMELGAAVCRGRKPLCEICPISAGCPSRGRAVPMPVAVQGRFPGSRRAARGAILHQLARRPGHCMALAELSTVTGRTREDRDPSTPLETLIRDGLVHVEGEWLHLGPRDEAIPLGTIGA